MIGAKKNFLPASFIVFHPCFLRKIMIDESKICFEEHRCRTKTTSLFSSFRENFNKKCLRGAKFRAIHYKFTCATVSKLAGRKFRWAAYFKWTDYFPALVLSIWGFEFTLHESIYWSFFLHLFFVVTSVFRVWLRYLPFFV